MENELRVLHVIHSIRGAEAEHYEVHGNYASLSGLDVSEIKLIGEDVARHEASGYELRVEVQASSYRVIAKHRPDPTMEYRSFYCDQTGVIRESWGSSIATADSRPIDK